MQPKDILQALASMELDERVQVLGAAFSQLLTAYRQHSIHFCTRHDDGTLLSVSASIDPEICVLLQAMRQMQRDNLTRTCADTSDAARVIGRMMAKRGGRL